MVNFKDSYWTISGWVFEKGCKGLYPMGTMEFCMFHGTHAIVGTSVCACACIILLPEPWIYSFKKCIHCSVIYWRLHTCMWYFEYSSQPLVDSVRLAFNPFILSRVSAVIFMSSSHFKHSLLYNSLTCITSAGKLNCPFLTSRVNFQIWNLFLFSQNLLHVDKQLYACYPVIYIRLEIPWICGLLLAI